MAPAADGDIGRLLEIMARLRTPVIGCAWDLAQNFETIAPFTVEEAYEVAEAIARHDMFDLRDELGDLLLQVVFHSQMAQEQGLFDFGDVVAAINAKLVRRHPHVFGDTRDLTPDEVKGLWDSIKLQEKAARRAERGEREPAPAPAPATLDGVAAGLPPLVRALLLQRKAAAVGFDWADKGPVLDKVREEADEVAALLDDEPNDSRRAELSSEIGDLLFAVVNLARHTGVDPDMALAKANAKFSRRFAAIETALAAQGRTPAQSNLGEMDRLWDAAKAQGL
jgi:ATP diphosphatase